LEHGLTFILAYYLGSVTGKQLIVFFKQHKNAKRAEYLLENHGGAILTTSMLANMTRFWVAYVAGIQKYHFFKFLFYSSVASLTWVSLMVVIGYIAGSERGQIESIAGRAGLIGWAFLVLAFVILYISGKKEFRKFKEDKI
jgi:membrane protein DedA with SNARE-associated domain